MVFAIGCASIDVVSFGTRLSSRTYCLLEAMAGAMAGVAE